MCGGNLPCNARDIDLATTPLMPCPHSGSGWGVNMIIDFTEFSRPHSLASLTRLGAMDIIYSLTFEPTA